MTIKASAGSAMILAAGLLAGLAGSLPARAAGADADSAAVSKSESTASDKSATHKRYAHRKSTHTASKPAESRKADEKQVADASGATAPAMPARVANANAQMTAANAPPDSAKGMSAAMSEKANTVLQAAADKPADAEAPAEPGAVASDQNDNIDRSLTPSEQPVATTTQGVVLASTSRPSSDAYANDSSTLDKTSLIGKVFIAFGALLTLASAARMFMA
jgi:hypothetical protein